MRAFIAGIIDKNQINSLVSLRDEVARSALRSRPVMMENLHVTLEFLGEITGHQADIAADILDSLDFHPFGMTIDKIGTFRSPDGCLVWAGPSRAPGLMALQQRLHHALREEGFRLDERRFTPHITLLRKVVNPVLPESLEPIRGHIVSVTLFQSVLHREGPSYTPLHSVR